MSALGYGRPTTPNLARFAARGAVFTAAHANGGWTLPGIGSLLTGLRPPAHRIDGPSFTIPAALRALPAILKEHGYRVPGFLDWYQERGFGFEAVESPYRMPYVGEARAKSELALRWLDEHRGEPSFVWLHQVVVHLPYEPSAESVALFADPASESDPAAAGFDGSRVRRSTCAGSVAARSWCSPGSRSSRKSSFFTPSAPCDTKSFQGPSITERNRRSPRISGST